MLASAGLPPSLTAVFDHVKYRFHPDPGPHGAAYPKVGSQTRTQSIHRVGQGMNKFKSVVGISPEEKSELLD